MAHAITSMERVSAWHGVDPAPVNFVGSLKATVAHLVAMLGIKTSEALSCCFNAKDGQPIVTRIGTVYYRSDSKGWNYDANGCIVVGNASTNRHVFEIIREWEASTADEIIRQLNLDWSLV